METLAQTVQWDLLLRILLRLSVSTAAGLGAGFIANLIPNKPALGVLRTLFTGLNLFGGLAFLLAGGMFFFVVGFNTYGATEPNPPITHWAPLIDVSYRIALVSAPFFGVGFGFRIATNTS